MARLDKIIALIDEYWKDGVFEERERREVQRMGRRRFFSAGRIDALIEERRQVFIAKDDDETRLHRALQNSIEFMLSSVGNASRYSDSSALLSRWKARKQALSTKKMSNALGLSLGQLERLEDFIATWHDHPEGSKLKLMAGYRLGACICQLEAKSRRNFKLHWTPTNHRPDAARHLRKLIHDLEGMIRETLYELVGGKSNMLKWIAEHFPKEADQWTKNRGAHGILQELYFKDLFRLLLHPAMRKGTERVFKKQDVLAFGGSVNRSLQIIGEDCNALRNKAAHLKEINHYDLPRLDLYYDAIVAQLNAARERGDIDVHTGSGRRYAPPAPSELQSKPPRKKSRWKRFAAVMAVLFILFLIGSDEDNTVAEPTETATISGDNNTASGSMPEMMQSSLGRMNPNQNEEQNEGLAHDGTFDWADSVAPVNDGDTTFDELTTSRINLLRTVSSTQNNPKPDTTIKSDPTESNQAIIPDSPQTEIIPDRPQTKSIPTNPCNNPDWGTSNNQKTVLMDKSGWIPLFETPSSSAKSDLLKRGTEVEILEKRGKFRLVRTCNGQSGYVRKQQMRD